MLRAFPMIMLAVAAYNLLVFGGVQEEGTTLFAGVSRVPPAHTLVLRPERSSWTLALSRHWALVPPLAVGQELDPRALEAKGLRRSSILVGNNGLFYPLELARGADGPMTGVAYPEMLTEVYRAMQAGNRDLADDLFEIYLPLVRYETQAGVSLAWWRIAKGDSGTRATARKGT